MTSSPATGGATTSPALATRRAALGALAAERFDVLVVGGGIVGSGALLDAASRGLRAALIEQTDIGAGTSSRSSRLIHGGLRYLEQLHFGLVAEALEERARILRLAPHLVRLEPFLFPIYGLPLVHQGFYGAGIFLYDLLGSRHGAGFARHMRAEAAREFAPQLRPEGLQAGIEYHDGVEDDARYTLAVLRTAIQTGPGAVVATRVQGQATLHRRRPGHRGPGAGPDDRRRVRHPGDPRRRCDRCLGGPRRRRWGRTGSRRRPGSSRAAARTS